jgi:xanthine dehydrogenase YagS FAD-binding subunit
VRSFTHINAHTIEEAYSMLDEHRGSAVLKAGGTDLLGVLKDEILPHYPRVVINVKTIPGLNFITEDERGLTLGALTTLHEVANSSLVKERYPALAEAARSVATPQIRNAATIGGNLCQDVRCWYYRYPLKIGGPLQCARKGSGPCLAVKGDNRYHAILEGKRCFAVCPSDMAVPLAALNAEVKIAGPKGERKVGVAEFFKPLRNALGNGEMVTEIEIPSHQGQGKQAFIKFSIREPGDFALVSVASAMTVEGGLCTDARIAIGAVAPGPVRAREAEAFLIGQPVHQEVIFKAAEQSVVGARPLSMNAYKVEITKALVRRAIRQALE